VAMAAPASTLTTAEELQRMPRGRARHELVRGELRVMCLPGAKHGRVALRIGSLLDTHAARTGCGVAFGELGFLLSSNPDTVRGPDAAFISRERFEAVGETTKYWPGPPDLAVEVVSPNDTFGEVQEKAREWIAAGCVAVLVLDPDERTATVYRAGGDSHIYAGEETVALDDAVPGFGVLVSELF
jgi:Uma2 family endonuclease